MKSLQLAVGKKISNLFLNSIKEEHIWIPYVVDELSQHRTHTHME